MITKYFKDIVVGIALLTAASNVLWFNVFLWGKLITRM